MSNHHCYLCATDEGILLDIFGDNGKKICGKIETCLSIKIEERNALSTKICHKCAYELDACSKFVKKYQKTKDVAASKLVPNKGHCSLCREPAKKGYIFDCKDGNPLDNPLTKIHYVFNDNMFKDKRRKLAICLDCRYNLDVLFDLKSIYQTTPDKLKSLKVTGLNLSQFPKTKTRVVSRKTTFIPLPRLNGAELSDTDSSSTSTIVPKKRKRGRPRKNSDVESTVLSRTCEECQSLVKNGNDMYRYHRTGRAVCKECWLSMDPEEVTHRKRKKLGLGTDDIGTRRCSILLKDVISNPAKYNDVYKMEKDEHGNTTFIITDDSSENEDKEKTSSTKRSWKSYETIAIAESTTDKRTRPGKRTTSVKSFDDDDDDNDDDDDGDDDDDDGPPAKVKAKFTKMVGDAKPLLNLTKGRTNAKTKNGLAISDTEAVFVSRTRRKLVKSAVDGNRKVKAASDAEVTKPAGKKKGRPSKSVKSEPTDSSSTETKIQVPHVTTKTRRPTKNVGPIVGSSEQTEQQQQSVRRTRANSSSSSHDTISLSNRLSGSSRNVKSVSDNESPPPGTTKLSKIRSSSTNNKSASELDVELSYTCKVCHVEYKNRLIGMKHELSHAKQPEVKLERIAIPETIVEEPLEVSSLIEEPEEQSHDVSSTSDHPSEDVVTGQTIQTVVTETGVVDAAADIDPDVNKINVDKENVEERKLSSEVNEVPVKLDENKDEQDKVEEKEEDKREAEKHGEKEEEREAPVEAENADKTQVAEPTEDETSVQHEKSDKNDVPHELNDAPSMTDEDIKNNDEEVEERGVKGDDSKQSESVVNEQVEKEDGKKDGEEVENTMETSQSVDNIINEQVSQQCTETAGNVNGTAVENDTVGQCDVANDVSKTVSIVAPDADRSVRERSTESQACQIINDDKIIVENKASVEREETTEDTDEKAKEELTTATNEDDPMVEPSETTKSGEESEFIVSEVLTEVFDLATAEVQKRLENEKPRDEKCTTPVSETLENISLEICNSADMPSLEPLVDDQSGNNRS